MISDAKILRRDRHGTRAEFPNGEQKRLLRELKKVLSMNGIFVEKRYLN